MRITVVGAGYVGLVTGVGLASKGHVVRCVDVAEDKVKKINAGKAPIYEEGLEELLGRMVREGKLKAASKLSEAAAESDAAFICVGTPSNDDGSVNLSHVFEAAKQLGKAIKGKKDFTVIVKSTVLPGTTEQVGRMVEKEAGKKFGLAMNPEFLREGRALEDFLGPDRIILGAADKKSLDVLKEVYASFDCPKFETDLRTAEMIKYASNAFLATKVSFINEVGNVCKKLGVDAYDVAKGMGLDPRIGPRFLEAGCGFGGSCFPKDVRALVFEARKRGVEPVLLQAVLNVNEAQPFKLVELAGGGLKGKNVAVLGLAFKAGTDDVREAPAIMVIRKLLDEGARVVAYDPKAAENMKKIFPNVAYAASAGEAVKNADVVFVLTEWPEFKDRKRYAGKKVFLGRKIFPGKSKDDLQGICW